MLYRDTNISRPRLQLGFCDNHTLFCNVEPHIMLRMDCYLSVTVVCTGSQSARLSRNLEKRLQCQREPLCFYVVGRNYESATHQRPLNDSEGETKSVRAERMNHFVVWSKQQLTTRRHTNERNLNHDTGYVLSGLCSTGDSNSPGWQLQKTKPSVR